MFMDFYWNEEKISVSTNGNNVKPANKIIDNS